MKVSKIEFYKALELFLTDEFNELSKHLRAMPSDNKQKVIVELRKNKINEAIEAINYGVVMRDRDLLQPKEQDLVSVFGLKGHVEIKKELLSHGVKIMSVD